MRSWVRRAGAVLLVGAAFFFLGRAMLARAHELQAFEWQLQPVVLLGSLALHVAVLCFGVLIWAETLRQLGHHRPYPVVARAWFLSNLARYIPGKIWQFVGVAEFMRPAGVTPLISVTSVVVYTGFILLSAWIVGVYLIPAGSLGPAAPAVPIVRVLTPALLLALHPRLLDRLIRLAGRLTRRTVVGWNGSWLTALRTLASCVLLWLGFGAAFHLFVEGITEVSLVQYPALTAIFALSFLGGYVVVVAPAGLGAKEGALAALLASFLPVSVAAAIAVAARFWSAIAEVLPALFYLRGKDPRKAGSRSKR